MKTTYTYKLYQFENGLGEIVYQAKERGFLGLWFWIYARWPFNEFHQQWKTHEAALKALRERAELHFAEHQESRQAEQRAKLKLIIIEPVKIDL